MKNLERKKGDVVEKESFVQKKVVFSSIEHKQDSPMKELLLQMANQTKPKTKHISPSRVSPKTNSLRSSQVSFPKAKQKVMTQSNTRNDSDNGIGSSYKETQNSYMLRKQYQHINNFPYHHNHHLQNSNQLYQSTNNPNRIFYHSFIYFIYLSDYLFVIQCFL
jgi:hypothetical protein